MGSTTRIIKSKSHQKALVNKYTGRVQSCYQPTNISSTLSDFVIFTELPGVADSGRYSGTFSNFLFGFISFFRAEQTTRLLSFF